MLAHWLTVVKGRRQGALPKLHNNLAECRPKVCSPVSCIRGFTLQGELKFTGKIELAARQILCKQQ